MKQVLHFLDDRIRQRPLRYLDGVGKRVEKSLQRNQTYQQFVSVSKSARIRQSLQHNETLQRILLFPDHKPAKYIPPIQYKNDDNLIREAALALDVSEEDIVENAGDSYNRYFATLIDDTASEFTLTHTARHAIRERLRHPNIFIA